MALEQCQSLAERSAYLLNTGHLSDVTFVVGKSDRQMKFKGHKVVLTAASEVFEFMLYGASSQIAPTILVPDVEPQAFEKMLRYIYLDDKSFDRPEFARSMLHVAHKYRLKHLQELSAWFAMHTIAAENVCDILDAAHLYGLKKLQKAVMYYICRNAEEVIESKGFLNARFQIAFLIVSQDYLGISEDKIIEAVVKWAHEQCNRVNMPKTWENIREIIALLLPHLRFKVLTVEQFTALPLENKILHESESLSIMMNIVTPGSKQLPSWFCQKGKRIHFPQFHSMNIPDKQIGAFTPGLDEPENTLLVKTKFKFGTDYGILNSLTWENPTVLRDLHQYLNVSTNNCGQTSSHHQKSNDGDPPIIVNRTILGELVVHNMVDNFEIRHTVALVATVKGTLEVVLPGPLLLCQGDIYEISLRLKCKSETTLPKLKMEDIVERTNYIHFYENGRKTSEENHCFHRIKLHFLS